MRNASLSSSCLQIETLLFTGPVMTSAEHQVCVGVHLLGAYDRLSVLVWELFKAVNGVFLSLAGVSYHSLQECLKHCS